ncbi:MAG: tRNA guanosine(34) transglycosylase Tgt [Candidatus Latescibacteria bacterium]|nr:tRNA guanosine(34) transglycosylase Tgt [Candidatus Latescibacterota bacterium]MBT4137494.1 tRNA guanosine(34) transglycosylase Tgt [Candidatus Latescibacterota bacterium]
MNVILETAHGALQCPAFLPDGTRGVVRALDATDVANCGVEAMMVNALHLSSHPGTTVVKQMGGIHSFMGWDKPVMSDSGGYQVFSLIAENPKSGSISKKGFVYRLGNGGKKQTLTPEKCIQKQFHVGADVMFCLDHCTHPNAGVEEQKLSVKHTIAWAKQCRDEFDRRQDRNETKLFGVVQGGMDFDLRQQCVEQLVEIGFDGYGFGGWPISDDGALVEAVAWVAELLPKDLPKHALGIGKPENVVRAFHLGYDTFDCTIPTRDARHKRLCIFNDAPDRVNYDSDFYRYVYIDDERYARDAEPVDPTCDCLCCKHYSRSYLHHLFDIRDTLAFRLATIHNLRFYVRMMAQLSAISCEALQKDMAEKRPLGG